MKTVALLSSPPRPPLSSVILGVSATGEDLTAWKDGVLESSLSSSDSALRLTAKAWGLLCIEEHFEMLHIF